MRLCKYCRTELKEEDKGKLYCSQWCFESRTKLKLKKKQKYKKVHRICICGKDLKGKNKKCDDCKATLKFQYVKGAPCLECGTPVSGRNYLVHLKKFCKPKCAKAYKYKLKLSTQKIEAIS